MNATRLVVNKGDVLVLSAPGMSPQALRACLDSLRKATGLRVVGAGFEFDLAVISGIQDIAADSADQAVKELQEIQEGLQ